MQTIYSLGEEMRGHEFNGIIRNIFEVSYLENNLAILFKCDWSRGHKKYEYGYFSIAMTRLYYTNDHLS